MNHGPDDKGPERPGPVSDGSGGLDGLGGLASDELDLRGLLHSAVDGIEPRSGTLEHLRRAVPARRARKRQAVVGMAAAALFIGTAVPALVHVSQAGGSDPNTAMAGQSSQAQGGTGQSEGGKDTDKGTPKDPGGTTVKPGREPGKPDEKDDKGSHAGTAPGSVDPSATLTTGAPLCTAIQLGSATGTVNAPDSAGVVYGSFRVGNVSEAACTVAGPGTITPTAQGAADQSKITAVRHVAGDAATTLPDPSLEVSSLVLQPGAAYEERFAFVPSETCPTTGGSTSGSETGAPSPDPTPTQDPGDSGGTTDTTGAEGATTQLATEDGTADGSIVVSHTAQGGAPTATATVPGACAGTVYYTGVIAGA
ncbi:hypothetical protein [Streptomyces sp. SP2-10]|uniref:hypothetical protein n=1 Tax=Streptomyces sp. SP2-10 TaxID=2873385 RepID=UPI001CA624AA|nr:hypothetical protein [Streptomyces sp. SP2-10]MBY8841858.1 hypothetical protein [Streptomyces sp. SP2-10]